MHEPHLNLHDQDPQRLLLHGLSSKLIASRFSQDIKDIKEKATGMYDMLTGKSTSEQQQVARSITHIPVTATRWRQLVMGVG